MHYALMIEPQQGLPYTQQLAVARRVEALGFETLFRSDHYDSFPGGLGRPTTDAWAVLAGLARETQTIRLGTLVSPVTFRHPGHLAKVAATVQEMSGGRVEFGLGTGWNEGEHKRFGLPFPPIAERADMLEEQLAILRGLWQEPDGWSFEGRHWTIGGSLTRPRPDPVPSLIVGGEGSPRSLRIAARWADEFNLTLSTPEIAVQRFAALDAAAVAIGRDPATLRRSVMIGTLVGRDAADVERRKRDLIAWVGPENDGAGWFEAHQPRWLFGTPAEARVQAAKFIESGCDRLMLQTFTPWDLSAIDLLADVIVR